MHQHRLSCQAPHHDKSNLAVKTCVAADMYVNQLRPPPTQSPHKTRQRAERQQQFAEFFILIYLRDYVAKVECTSERRTQNVADQCADAAKRSGWMRAHHQHTGALLDLTLARPLRPQFPP